MYLANCKINYGCMTYLHIEPLLTLPLETPVCLGQSFTK